MFVCEGPDKSSSSCTLDEVLSASVKDITLPSIPPGNSATINFYVKALTVTTRNFNLKVRYLTEITTDEVKESVACETEASISTQASILFMVSVWCEDRQFHRMTQICPGMDFFVTPRISCQSHVPVVITESKLMLSESAVASCDGHGCVGGSELSSGEMADDCFSLRHKNDTATAQNLSLGYYVLTWNRKDSPSPPVSECFPSHSRCRGVGHRGRSPPASTYHTQYSHTHLLHARQHVYPLPGLLRLR